MKFSDIPGHDGAKQRLRQMVANNRVPHALLIEGPAGIGKLSMARAFAQYIQCENPDPDGDACGVCQNCKLHQSMNHVDTHYVYPVVKLDGMNSAPVSDDFRDQWLEYLDGRTYMDFDAWAAMFGKKNAQPITYVTESAAVTRKLSFTANVARQNIVVWWLPERLKEECANKLLKMIEEPYPDTVIIMVSDRPSEILPTIYSRVQRVQLKRLDDGIVARYLMDHKGLSQADAMAAAHIADGSMPRAFAAVNASKESTQYFDLFKQLMRLAYQRNVKELRDWADTLAGLGRERTLRFYDYAIRLIRENFVYNFHIASLNYLTTDEASFSTNFARFINEKNVEKLIEVFDSARPDIAGNGNGKIVNMDVAIKVIMLIKRGTE